MKPTMDDLRNALKGDGFIESMENIGFKFIRESLAEEYGDTYFFFHEDLIVYFDAMSGTFWTYPVANHGSI